MHRIEIDLEKRILVLDGAMGSMIQQYNLQEKDYRTRQLKKHDTELKGNTDALNLSRPDVVRDIHRQYLEAGADIISTNTFGANAISQADYGLGGLVYAMNYEGAAIAKDEAEKAVRKDPSKRRYVAGAMGPTTRLASLSPDVADPAYRTVSFDQLAAAYAAQARALIDGGVDLLLLETVTDTLNAKAALFAIVRLFEEKGREWPIMISGTVTDASGRLLAGQTIEAFLVSISHAPILSVGLNCSLGAAELQPYMPILHRESPFYVSVHPNAGLPNEFGQYDQTPDEFARLVFHFAENGWLNIAGGCCGTTPAHINAMAAALKHAAPRNKTTGAASDTQTDAETLSKINNWRANDGAATFNMQELTRLISMIEDENTFLNMKRKFDVERQHYHPEQAMLLNAHIFGRYQYLTAENRIRRNRSA